MSSGKNLGLFWGNNAFSIVESQQDVPQKVLRVLHHPAPALDPVSPVTNTDDIQFVNPLKEALKANNITSTDVNLVLPSKDIVIRSFVIPMLKPSEVRGVVEFEIKKYIPFNLKDLSYNFHATMFVEDKIKRMRVHFVAIRREILERYKLVLKQAGLNVVYSEPAPMCLARVLLHRKIIKSDQKVAVLQTDFNDPGIVIIDKGIVQFVRDFQLQNPALNMAPLDVEMLKKKLFNEIKISLDFYTRQFKSGKIEELFTLSFNSDEDLSGALQKELDLSVKKINLQSLGKFPTIPDFGLVSAHGVNLRTVAKAVDFNLSGVLATTSQAAKLQEQIPEEFIPAVKVAVVCAAILAVVFFLTKLNTAQFKKQYDAVVEVQGGFVDMKPDDIQSRIKENLSRLKDYKDAYQASEMAYVLTHIAKTLPTGIWLTKMEIKYAKEKIGSTASSNPVSSGDPAGLSKLTKPMTINLSGYAYTSDANEQFKMVYGLVNALKSNTVFTKYFRDVNLAAIQSQQSGDYVLTSFTIEVN
jgi:Tfp pilus assembly PilM family ATPase